MNELLGFRFQGYRSFPSNKPAVLYPLSKINLLAGQNNTGKSNILRVISGRYSDRAEGDADFDRPITDSEHRFSTSEFWRIDDLLEFPHAKTLTQERREQLRRFLSDEGFTSNSPPELGIWFDIQKSGVLSAESAKSLSKKVTNHELAETIARDYDVVAGRSPIRDANTIFDKLFHEAPTHRVAFVVEGSRVITVGNDNEPDLNGSSIKLRLLKLQNPTTNQLDDKKIFAKIQDFVRAVMDDGSITIDIPHDLSTVHVTQGGVTLPIEYLGTGVHEVVILAAAATVVQNSILCIEEPEVHLHPILQRKLLRYLFDETDNQYFIATHSAHMLDSALGSIFHVSRHNGVSEVRYVGSASERSAICADLGYRPSDLVQTNAIIWVEGPSDRIYIKHWIETLAPDEFFEGTHYSLMFYGGGLLNALSPLDDKDVDADVDAAVEEFISLRKLNRYMAVVIDSDKEFEQDELNASKQRVIDELAEDPKTGVAWVTDGYTIENYILEETLTKAIRLAHPKSTEGKEFDKQARWTNPLSEERVGTRPNKIKIAKAVIAGPPTEWKFDLQQKVEEIIELIRAANAHE